MTDLQRAIDGLAAVRHGRGRYAYYADEIRAAVSVDAADMRDYGARLRRDEPDAYSRWCAASLSERLSRADRLRLDLPVMGDE